MLLPETKRMAGLKGKSGPPGNMNAFKHGLAANPDPQHHPRASNVAEITTESQLNIPELFQTLQQIHQCVRTV